MDTRTFDAVARTIAGGTSRRQALRLLAAGALAGFLPRRSRAAPAAQGDECDPGLTFCEEQPGWAPAGCYDLSSDYLHCGDCMFQCPSAGPVAMACSGGACVATDCGDLTDCTGNLDCTDLGSDPYNCGFCGNACDSGLCQGGVCAAAMVCEPGLTLCGVSAQFSYCTDLTKDYSNCGACGVECPYSDPNGLRYVCVDGTCLEAGCALGLSYCTDIGACVDLGYDANNCGACGNACASGVCQAGVCAAGDTTCEAGRTFCPAIPPNAASAVGAGAGCYDLSSDYLHCGSCDLSCQPADPIAMDCIGGECVPIGCVLGWTDCGNFDCRHLPNDPLNCGACGNVCESGICEGLVCVPSDTTCAAGLAYCPARQITVGFDNQPYELAAGCFDLFSDRFHCGSCDTTCPTTVGCIAGVCTIPQCEGSLSQCDAGCVDLLSDPNNCGACGNVCDGGGFCEAGTCVLADTKCDAGLTFCPERSDGQPAGCYDLSSDYWHCGTCDLSCPTAGFHGVCSAGQCTDISCAEGLTYCTAQRNGLQPGCYDLASDPDHCGTCQNACASGGCEAGECVQQAAQTASEDAEPATTTPAAGQSDDGQEQAPVTLAAPAGGGEINRPARSARTRDKAPKEERQGVAPERSAASAPAASDAVLIWPFDPAKGQWTIVQGYRAENAAATPTADRDFARFALEFAVCSQANVDAGAGICDLGETEDEPGWDRTATQGSTVRSPVDGTVAWTEGETSCLGLAIDVTGHPGYRLALFNVEGSLERGQVVKRGKRIGMAAASSESGCAGGDRIQMVLYKPQAGSDDDPAAAREGVPFAGAWTIADCDYPDDGQTVEQYRGELVPCPSPEKAS